MTLAGEIALVTGASRGIGQAIALMLGQQGAFVIGTATTPAGADRIRNSFDRDGVTGSASVLDVSDAESIARLFAWLAESDHQPTVVVNNAGITRDGLLARMSEEDWQSVIDTNLTSIYRVCKSSLRAMMKARHGRIINITSVVGAMGNPGQANYAAAKAGMMGFTRSLAREVGGRGITVNAISPGFIDTDMTRDLPEAQREALIAQIPLKRLGSATDVAAAAAFLASPAAAYITGETLHVNGGMYMG